MEMFLLIDHSGKTPSVWRSPATTATVPLTSASPRAPSKTRMSICVWPWPAQPGQAHDLALVRGQVDGLAVAQFGAHP